MLSKQSCELFANIDPWDKYPDVEVNDSDTVELMKKKNKIERIKNDRFDAIKEFIDEEPGIYAKEGRSEYYHSEKRVSKNDEEYTFTYIKYNDGKGEVSRKLFLKFLKQYWKRGKCEFALYPNFDKCGIPKKVSQQVGRKRGPKYSGDPDKGRSMTQRDKDIFESFIKEEIIKNKRPLETVHGEMIRSTRYKYEFDHKKNGYRYEENPKTKKLEKVLLSDDKKPSISQFRNYYYKSRSPESRLKNKMGERTHNLQRRVVEGSKKARYPGQEFEIDATVLDFYIRSEYPPYSLIGQPVFYVIIDVYSRFIIGWYMGVGRPSGQAALMTLVNMATDKRKLLERIGYVDNQEFLDIDAHFSIKGIPKKLTIDQAELRDNVPKHIQKRFRMKISHTTARRPDWKGSVENRFDTLTKWESIYDPSYGNYHRKKYGDPDVRKEAIKTFNEMYMDFIDLVYEHNHSIIKNTKILNNLTLSDGVMPIPVELFKHGVSNIGGCVRAYSESTIIKNFLKPEKATKTREGIKFKGLYFKPIMDGYEEFLISSQSIRGSKKSPDNELEVLYNESILDRIYLPLDNVMDPVECILLNKCDFEVQAELPEGFLDSSMNSIKNRTWYEFDDLRVEYNQKFKESKEYTHDVKNFVNKRLKERADKAQEETEKLTKNMSNAEFLRGARERKNDLKDEHDKRDAQEIINQYNNADSKDLDDKSNDKKDAAGAPSISYTDLISQKMKEHSKTGGK